MEFSGAWAGLHGWGFRGSGWSFQGVGGVSGAWAGRRGGARAAGAGVEAAGAEAAGALHLRNSGPEGCFDISMEWWQGPD